MLQLAYERARQLLDAEHVLVCTGASYAGVVAKQLPELPAENLLGEPEGRDSLNAVAWPAAVLARRDGDAVVAVLTADQLIRPVGAFVQALDKAFQVAEADPKALVTFGVVPNSAHTGYGYLERGADVPGFELVSQVREFKEKPDEVTAERYLKSGRYWWNAGMFVWRADTLLEQLAQLQPATYKSIVELAEHPERLGDIYPKLFKTSVDYAIMEPVSHGRGSAHVVSVALPITWLDVGSYATLAEALAVDGQANPGFGARIARDSAGNLLINTDGPDTLLAVTGLSNMAVVRTPQITLVAPLSASQQIKPLVADVAEQFGRHLA